MRRRRQRWLWRRWPLGPLVALLVALSVSACGDGAREPPGDRIAGHTLTVYTSLPLQGSASGAARQILAGERLALAQSGGRIGGDTILLKALDDDTVTSRGWDPGQTSADAHRALADPTTIGYIGDFTSGASAVAIPLLNRLGIAQISPASSAVGLTSAGPGASPGEPAKYYPSGRRTFVGLVPDDAAQASAQVQLQRSLGCRRTYVLHDGEFDGSDAAASFAAVAATRRQTVVAVQGFDPRATDYLALAAAVAQADPGCILISALPGAATTLLTSEVAAAVPRAWLLGTASLAQPSFAVQRRGGISDRLDPRVLITAPVDAGNRPARAFAVALPRVAQPPGPFAAYGYEAMRMMLAAVAHATDTGRQDARRSGVVSALFGLQPRDSVLGSFAVTRQGRTTVRRYGVYLLRAGKMSLWTTVDTGRR